jgi:Flp pilus assembly protein TadG
MLSPHLKWPDQKTRQEQGQSLVEFALVLTFIIIPFTLVLIESSVVLYKYVSITNAAREGVRAGSIYLFVGDPGNSPAVPDAGRSTAVSTAVRSTIVPLISPPATCDGGGATTACAINYAPNSAPFADPLRATDIMTVTVAHTHTLLFGALGADIDLQSQASMRIEPSTVISGTGP